jgi:hypothetical protein
VHMKEADDCSRAFDLLKRMRVRHPKAEALLTMVITLIENEMEDHYDKATAAWRDVRRLDGELKKQGIK